VFTILDWVLLLTVPFAALLISLFTREGSYLESEYTWGWIWGTYDNPPQGDKGFVHKRCLFPSVTTGLKGYLNRVHWMVRNPLYGFAKVSSIKYSEKNSLTYVGDPDISDKGRRPGYYIAKLKNESGELLAFEFYGVFPYTENRNLRIRLGWKMMTDKFSEYGFAQLVNTINPFDGYGDN
jgi:hypothetical protein